MNKLITVYIDYNDIPENIIPQVSFTAAEFKKQIEDEVDDIYTTQTSAISSFYYTYHDNGWDIKVVHKDKYILFSELLGDYEGSRSFGREVRLTQNWEKMFYSNCFDVNLED